VITPKVRYDNMRGSLDIVDTCRIISYPPFSSVIAPVEIGERLKYAIACWDVGPVVNAVSNILY
jgi:hypothetical protein